MTTNDLETARYRAYLALHPSPLTLADVNIKLVQLRLAFHSLNNCRELAPYHPLDESDETTLGRIADEIARLGNVRSHLAAKQAA